MQVQGHYQFRGGAAHLILQPVMAAPGEDMKPPTAKAILEMMRSGDLVVHPTKANLTKSQISVHICNIQRQVSLQLGRVENTTVYCCELREVKRMETTVAKYKNSASALMTLVAR
jgi:hypothetical protein